MRSEKQLFAVYLVSAAGTSRENTRIWEIDVFALAFTLLTTTETKKVSIISMRLKAKL